MLQPTLVLSGSDAIFVGPAFDLTPHRIAAHALVLALDRPFALALPAEAPPCLSRIAAIPAGVRHGLRAAGAMAFVYSGRPVAQAAADPDPDALAGLARAIAAAQASDDCRLAAAMQLLGRLGIGARPSLPTPIDALLAAIDGAPGDIAGLDMAADLAGLSPQRLQRALRRETGLTFRQHRLRARMAAVARAIGQGETLTTAAHDAGFASSAHLSATFRTMFGIAPSDLRRIGTHILGLP